MTDNLSVNVNLNSQSQSSNLIENVSQDSLPGSSEMSTEEKLLSMETPMSRLLANSGGGLENAETPKMTSLGLPPGSVLTATTASDTISPWGGGYQGSRSDNKLIDLAKIPLRVVGTAVTLGTYSTGLGGYEPVEFKERGDLRVQHDGDTGSTIIERLDPVDGKWKSEEGVAYRYFASEAGGEAKFVVNDEILTVSTGGRPIHEPGKDYYVDITPYPNQGDHDTTTPPYPMAEQDKDSHIQSNPLPGEKLPWRTETPAERMDEPTVMMNEKQDSGSIQGSDIESDHVSGPDGSKLQIGDVTPNTNKGVSDLLEDLQFQRDLKDVDYVDCDDIARKLYKASGEQGRILDLTVPDRNRNIKVREFGNLEEFADHRVFSDGEYIIDPRYSSNPIPIDQYMDELRELNPNVVIKDITP
jgi:hypothetical protein